MEFLYEYGLFLLKAITIVAAFVFILASIVSAAAKNRPANNGEVQIRDLSEELENLQSTIEKVICSKEELARIEKERKRHDKSQAKEKKKRGDEETNEGRLFVLDFDGDMKASEAENLREEVSAVLSVGRQGDSVLVRLESFGGMVHSYGFAASQLTRIKASGLKLIVSVDKVAASGGYMMACVADKIIAAPFAILGSIGVLAQIPNFNRIIRKHDIDVELHTAGEYKTTLTMFGENTDKGREKFKADIEDTHQLFKAHVNQHRPSLDIDKVATGETWYGSQAVENALIDEVKTSDDFVLEHAKTQKVYALSYEHKKPLAEKLGLGVAAFAEKALQTFFGARKQEELVK